MLGEQRAGVQIPIARRTPIPVLAGVLFRVAAQRIFAFECFRALCALVRPKFLGKRMHFAHVRVQFPAFDEAVLAHGALEWSIGGVGTQNVILQAERTHVGGVADLQKRWE